jgi:hypothetical protein
MRSLTKEIAEITKDQKQVSKRHVREREEKNAVNKSLRSMKRRPMLVYDVVGLHIMSCISHSSRIGALQGCAHCNLQKEEQKDWPGPRFPASIADRYQYHRLTSFIYVNAAYCGANPVSHPNPLNPPCTALDPHCWASTLGRGRAGIGADAGGGL